MTAKFVDFIPSEREDGVLYVSKRHSTAVHNCACGCGNKVVTPLGSSGWELQGASSVSLSPSIGNWGFPCQSHYWIHEGAIDWSTRWTREQIAAGAAADKAAVLRAYAPRRPFWRRALNRLRSLITRSR